MKYGIQTPGSISERAESRLNGMLSKVKNGKVEVTLTMFYILKRLEFYGGVAGFNDIRKSRGHAQDVQRALIFGLIKPIPKDCAVCPHKVKCLGSRKRCSRRYLYQITEVGVEALGSATHITPVIDNFWVEYFKRKIW